MGIIFKQGQVWFGPNPDAPNLRIATDGNPESAECCHCPPGCMDKLPLSITITITGIHDCESPPCELCDVEGCQTCDGSCDSDECACDGTDCPWCETSDTCSCDVEQGCICDLCDGDGEQETPCTGCGGFNGTYVLDRMVIGNGQTYCAAIYGYSASATLTCLEVEPLYSTAALGFSGLITIDGDNYEITISGGNGLSGYQGAWGCSGGASGTGDLPETLDLGGGGSGCCGGHAIATL